MALFERSKKGVFVTNKCCTATFSNTRNVTQKVSVFKGFGHFCNVVTFLFIKLFKSEVNI